MIIIYSGRSDEFHRSNKPHDAHMRLSYKDLTTFGSVWQVKVYEIWNYSGIPASVTDTESSAEYLIYNEPNVYW